MSGEIPSKFRGARVHVLLGALVLLWLGPHFEAFARDFDEAWLNHNWKTREGLPETWIDCLYEDRSGYLWIGTTGGGVRFDGFEFLTLDWWDGRYRSKDIEEDAAGRLWVATKSGVLVYDGQTAANRWPDVETTSLSPSSDGGIWVGTERGIVLVQQDEEHWWEPTELPSSFIYEVFEDSSGRVWVGTVVGLFRFDRESESFSAVWESPFPHTEREFGIVRCVAEGEDGAIWFGTDHSYFHWRDGQLNQVRLGRSSSQYRVRKIAKDSRGLLYFVIGGQVFRMEGGTLERWQEEDQEFDFHVNTLFVDSDTNIWLGTRYGGLFRRSESPIRIYTTADGLTHNDVRSISRAREGELLIGTGAGVDLFRENRFEALEVPSPNDEPFGVQSVYLGPHGTLWVGGDTAALARLRFDGESYQSQATFGMISDHQIRYIVEDHEEAIWIGSRRGLTRVLPREAWFRLPEKEPARIYYSESWIYRPKGTERWVTEDGSNGFSDNHGFVWEGDQYREHVHGELELRDPQQFMLDSALPKDDFTAGIVDRTGRVWSGTGNGEVCWLDDLKVRWIENSETQIDGRIHTFWEDQHGRMWVGSNSGLTVWDGERFVSFDDDSLEFSEESIRQVISDSLGYLWLGGSRGIYRVSMTSLDQLLQGRTVPIQVSVFDEEDGLVSSDISSGVPGAYRDEAGKIWMPSTYGLLKIDPDKLNADLRGKSSAVRIDTVEANGRILFDRQKHSPIGENEVVSVELQHHEANEILVRYSMPALSRPEKVRFRHRLAEEAASWTQGSDLRQIRYAHLGPGNYRIEIDGKTNRSVWTERPAVVDLHVVPPIYQTMVFWCLAGIGFGALAWGGHRWVLSRRQQFLALEHRAAMSDERNRIASDIHDDLGARIHQIGLLNELAMNEVASNLEAKQYLTKLMGVGRELSQSVDEIVWMLNPQNDTLARFFIYLKRYASSFFELAKIGASVSLALPDRSIPISARWRHAILMILKEAFRNVSAHSNASTVAVRAVLNPSQTGVVFEVVDDGCGLRMDDPGLGRGNGLHNMRRRAEELGGTLEVQSEPNSGTIVRVTVAIALSGSPGVSNTTAGGEG